MTVTNVWAKHPFTAKSNVLGGRKSHCKKQAEKTEKADKSGTVKKTAKKTAAKKSAAKKPAAKKAKKAKSE